jgi:hypothetical protein
MGGRGPALQPATPALARSASLHLPGESNGFAHRMRLRPIEIGLDLVMRLHARRHAETVRVGREQGLSLAQRDPNHHRVLVTHPYDQAVMDVPRRTLLGSLALDLRQRLGISTDLVRGHL